MAPKLRRNKWFLNGTNSSKGGQEKEDTGSSGRPKRYRSDENDEKMPEQLLRNAPYLAEPHVTYLVHSQTQVYKYPQQRL
jgi:hypothetical protein